ncbi:hypothetical protein M427DRAFT_130898 [Gonapodya prolifera JEL478]|uniref:Amidohydrolase-related domain-containing protein n=1 Tax=Gonapodya prolifera (strain JEL478) TaxID=1344416 RepID=A0A139AXJ2_GONPJ|nr:hypothetical protein M427DRAFT_130898 [Gonapodya prolifera JEL478]|eukprot:KXS21424.1 hypothetical protein M427DRAFT_130898 [Gonapodya prolifera JEL478]
MPVLNHLRGTSSAHSTLHTPSDAFYSAIAQMPLIDNHTHMIMKGYSDRENLHASFSEAEGDARDDVKRALAYRRAVKDLATYLNVPVTEAAAKCIERAKQDEQAFARDMIKASGVSQLLFDEGLYGDFYPSSWHDFLAKPHKRILRLERVAEDCLRVLALKDVTATTGNLVSTFEQAFMAALEPDASVVGYKSVAAYRSGLEVDPNALTNNAVVGAIPGILASYLGTLSAQIASGKASGKAQPPRVRVAEKKFVDWIVNLGIRNCVKHGLPLQFHTGHGDTDMDLRLGNPLHLQPLAKAYPDLKIVLLHTSYPFCRESGWMAGMFLNVFADFGELQPFASRDALAVALRELLHLAPASKVLYSSDAHLYPETYYFGALYFRDALATVLGESIAQGDLDESEAVEFAELICWRNSARIYQLKEWA